MFKIEDILSENFSAFPEETQQVMKKFNEKLRELIISELIDHMADRMLKDIDKSKEYFINVLIEILDNGCKGLNKMSTATLIEMYLEKKGAEDFIKLMDKVNTEMEV